MLTQLTLASGLIVTNKIQAGAYIVAIFLASLFLGAILKTLLTRE